MAPHNFLRKLVVRQQGQKIWGENLENSEPCKEKSCHHIPIQILNLAYLEAAKIEFLKTVFVVENFGKLFQKTV